MKPKGKFVMLFLSLAILAGAWLLAESMAAAERAGETAAVSAAAERIDLSVGGGAAVTALSWVWDGQTVNLVFSAESGVWENADDPACPIDQTRARALASAVGQVSASMAIPGATDLAQYGLAEPTLIVMAAAGDEIASYELGNMTITGECYLRISGESTVYLESGSLLPAFRVSIWDILETESVPSDIAAVTELEVSSAAQHYALRLGGDGIWRRDDGGEETPLETEKVRALYEELTELELSVCAAWDAENPSDYGLAQPQALAAVRYESGTGAAESFTLEFGDYAGTDVYVRLAGSRMVYLVPGAVLDAVMYPDWEALQPLSVMTLAKEEIAGLRIELDGKAYDIVRVSETREVELSGSKEPMQVTDVIYSNNGWGLDAEGMDAWLDALCAMMAEGDAARGGGRERLLSLEVTPKTAEEGQEPEPVTLELWSYDSRHDLWETAGRRLLVDRTEAEALVDRLTALLADA